MQEIKTEPMINSWFFRMAALFGATIGLSLAEVLISVCITRIHIPVAIGLFWLWAQGVASFIVGTWAIWTGLICVTIVAKTTRPSPVFLFLAYVFWVAAAATYIAVLVLLAVPGLVWFIARWTKNLHNGLGFIDTFSEAVQLAFGRVSLTKNITIPSRGK